MLITEVKNYFQAVKRIDSVETQVRGNPEKANVYKDAINQYVCCRGKGRQLMVTRLKVRYLLHHAVFRENKKTTKCSVVFDASAYDNMTYRSMSVNILCQGQHFNLISYQTYSIPNT